MYDVTDRIEMANTIYISSYFLDLIVDAKFQN